ncbi:MAG TPA: glycosyltransferase family 4 protein [Bacteroidia bacterium]
MGSLSHPGSKSERLLIIGSVWPEPNSSAAGSRMLQLIEIFRENSWSIAFASAAADSRFAIDLKSIDVQKETIELNSSSFDNFIKELQPQIVIFDRFMTEEQFGWRVAENCPEALRILDTEDLHCLRHARQTAWKARRQFSLPDLNNDIAKREIASIYRSDLSLIISKYEIELLKEYFKVDQSLLHYLPFMLEQAENSDYPDFSSRKHFITIGNFLHEPNWNSVQYLKEKIWPLIRKQLPQSELHVYGAYPSQKVFALHNEKEGFLVKGRADSAEDVIKNARVLLAPLRFGAGLKGKLVDAMNFGTPSVTTGIGAEAMHDQLDWSGLVADSAEGISNAATRLYSDEALWNKSQQNGFKIIESVYPKKSLGQEFINRVATLRSGIKEHRLNNFTGSMLMFHTVSGTKYMSKWIEEKNKL